VAQDFTRFVHRQAVVHRTVHVEVRRSHFMTIVAAWLITVPAAALLSAGLFAVIRGVMGTS
jgi:phosphate/sulfate permease